MALEKINYLYRKKGESTVASLVITMILVVGMFTTMFLFFKDQADNESFVIDEKYNESYTRLTETQESISDNINTIQDNVQNIKEADNSYQVAWNGLKGLGNIILLPFRFVSNAIEIVEAIFISGDFIPSNVKTLIVMALIIITVLIVIAAAKGEPII